MLRLLFPTDYSPCAERAFAQAVVLAERFGAELHVLHALAADTAVYDLVPHEAPEGLRLVEASVRGYKVREVILDYAERIDADLIVMGTHGRRGLQRLALGSIAERVVRLAPCPVLTVGPESPPAGALARLLVPVDFSARSEVALQHAALLADVHGARVDLLHALEIPSFPSTYALGVVWPDLGVDLLERNRAALAKLAEQYLGPDRTGQLLVEIGDPAAVILDTAEARRADLVVLATHGLTGLQRFALGSVAERVVQRAPCAVFTVKSFGRPFLPAPALAAADAGADAAR